MECSNLPCRDPVLGATEFRCGNITTLEWIAAREPSQLEPSLGFGAGRLNAGYWILLLNDVLTAADFIFEGTTLNSGGALGLPGASPDADALRPKMHDQILSERGPQGYKDLQQKRLKEVVYAGPNRLARVHAVSKHDRDMSPQEQYPMGGGGLQWRVIKPVRFFVACHVFLDRSAGPQGFYARTPDFTVSLQEPHGARRLENRMKLHRYLATTKPALDRSSIRGTAQ